MGSVGWGRRWGRRGTSRLPLASQGGCRGLGSRGAGREDRGGVLRRPGPPDPPFPTLFAFSFPGGAWLGAGPGSPDLVFKVLIGLASEEEEDGSLFLATLSEVFFLVFSPFVFTFTFCPLSFLLFSDWALLCVGGVFPDTAAFLLADDFWGGAFVEMGGALLGVGTSSIGSSLTGVASPRSTDWWVASGSSPLLL